MADKLKERISLLEEAEARAKAMGKTLTPEAQSELDTYRQRGLAKGQGGAASGAPTEAENKGNSFLVRAIGAYNTYEKAHVGPRSLIGQRMADNAPNVLNSLPSAVGNSPERQMADQAQDEFIIASVLRQDTGAAISADELDKYRRVYFPMPGDGADVIESKREARRRALEGLYSTAGRALKPETETAYRQLFPKADAPNAPTGTNAAVTPQTDTPAAPEIAPLFRSINRGAYGRIVAPETIDTEYKGVDNPELRAKNERILAAVANPDNTDEQILTLAANLGVDPAATGLNRILAYRKKTGLTRYADTTDYQTKVPLTGGEKFINSVVANPAVEFTQEAGNAATAGIPQAAAIAVGGENMQRKLAAARNTNPRAAIAGDVVGTIAGASASELAAARLLEGTKFAAQGARAGDAAFGAASGATSNPDDPLLGAVEGAATNVIGGEVGRRVIGGVASAVSPKGGKYSDIYPDGVRPTIGQRFAGTGVVGDAVNNTEQVLGAVPVLGAAVRGARGEGMTSWERAGINRALKEIGEKPIPRGVATGPEAFAYAHPKFTKIYDQARAGMQFIPDTEFGADVGQWQAKWKSGVLSGDQEAQVERVIANNVGDRLQKSGNILSGEKYKLATTALSDAAESTDSPAVRDALKDYADILKAGAYRASDPAAVAAMRKADAGWSLYKPLALAAGRAGSEPGRFTPMGVASVERMRYGKTQKYIEGNTKLNDYVNAGLRMRDTLGNTGSVGNQALAGLALSSGGAAITPAIPAVGGALTLPYLPLIRKGVSAVLAPRETRGLVDLADNIRAKYRPAGGPVGQGLLDAYLEQRQMQSQPGIAGAYR